jgi:hypothetical protein
MSGINNSQLNELKNGVLKGNVLGVKQEEKELVYDEVIRELIKRLDLRNSNNIPSHILGITQSDIDRWNNDEGLLTELDPTISSWIKSITQSDIDRWNSSKETTSNIIATTTIGAVNAGETISAGTDIQELVEKLFDKTYYPTYVEPIHSLTNNAGVREVGSSFDITLTFNFDRGKILGKLVNNVWKENEKQNDRLGEATSYSINGFPNNPTKFEVTTALGTNTLEGTVYYSKGAQPKDSKGDDFEEYLPAGESTQSTTFEGIYPYFYYKSKSPILASDMRDAIASGQATKVVGRSNGTIEIPFEAKGEYIAIAYPATSPDKKTWFVSALNSGVIPGGVLGPVNQLFCDSPGLWNDVPFKIYVSPGLITQPNPIQFKN